MGQSWNERRSASGYAQEWLERKDMVRQALAISIPWFTFVNISFSLMIYFRNVLFSNFDRTVQGQAGILQVINGIMIAVTASSLLLSLVIRCLPARLPPASWGCC